MKQIILWLMIVSLFSCTGEHSKQNTLVVFAAAGLTDVITEITDSFRLQRNVDIKLNLAASGTLARQIEQGASADVFFSANRKWMKYLADRNLAKDTAVLAGNDLVLVGSLTDSSGENELAGLLTNTRQKIAIGDPGYVPVGEYAQQVLDYYHLKLDGQLLQTTNVRSALMMVEIGEARYAIVYKTDALQSQKVRIVHTFPPETHQAVEYFQLLLSENQLARDFYAYLRSAEVNEILAKHQFKVY
ncbi:MAG: molybdate ABC transporter substrate-binding protein [Mangrovibacterium sp.]